MVVDVQAQVLANTRLSDHFNIVALEAPEIAAAAQPGQFVMVKAAEGLDPLLRRPFSIFEILRDQAGTATGLTLLNKRVGVVSSRIFALQPGQAIACLGPLGRPFDPVDPPVHAWLVAGGVGLAPFATLADALRRRGTPTTLFYGARRADELFRLDLFEQLRTRLVLATEDGSRGARALITEPLAQELAALPSTVQVMVYACGPTAMMQAVAHLAARHGHPSRVSLEQIMGCGMGGCYSCVVAVRNHRGGPDHVRSCIEGPVFDGQAIIWERLTH